MTLPAENLLDFTRQVRQVLLEAGTEVLGPRDAEAVFARIGEDDRAAPAWSILSGVYAAVKQQYGLPCGQGVGLRLGRAAFKYALRVWGQAAGTSTVEFRMLPAPSKARKILATLCEHFTHNLGARASLSEDAQAWLVRVEDCPACRGAQASQPDCPLISGLLQEVLVWAEGGRYHRVEEIACRAQGSPACLWRIEKKALD